MKVLNENKANLLLMFTRSPFIKCVNKELEYYTSDDERLIGFVSLDKIDGTFHSMLFDRDSQNKYCLVDLKTDMDSLCNAKSALEGLMNNYKRIDSALNKAPANDFFTIVSKPEQVHPYFKLLLEKDGAYVPAKSVIEELSYHFKDRDGNFVDQFQSINGFDARIWELYLWCYLREEDFNFNYDFDAPDFIVNKMGYEVAIEAVHIERKGKIDGAINIPTYEEIMQKIKSEIPLLYGSPLYSKLKHTYQSLPYWELPQVKGKPLVYAIADFHADMSMTWSFPGITSILYGIDQQPLTKDDGGITLQNESGIKYPKGKVEITPLFLDKQFKNVSAVMFSSCGTLTKFNRMGVQAGYDNPERIMCQMKICYNDSPNALLPDVFGAVVDENSHETWADGIQIFHNPFAEVPLNPALFPHAGHHFYDGGLLRSDIPHNHIISTMTYNVKNMPFTPPPVCLHSSAAFDELIRKWRM